MFPGTLRPGFEAAVDILSSFYTLPVEALHHRGEHRLGEIFVVLARKPHTPPRAKKLREISLQKLSQRCTIALLQTFEESQV